MHVTQVHPVTSENQFHCARLYSDIHALKHIRSFCLFSLCTFRHIALASESFKQFNGIQTHARVHRWHSLLSCSFKMSLRGKSYHFLAVMVHNLLWPMDRPAMLVFFFFFFLFFAQWRCLNLTDWRTNNSTDVYSLWKRNPSMKSR